MAAARARPVAEAEKSVLRSAPWRALRLLSVFWRVERDSGAGEGQGREGLGLWTLGPPPFSHIDIGRPRCFGKDCEGAAGTVGLLAVLGSCRQLEDSSESQDPSWLRCCFVIRSRFSRS